MFSAKAGRLLQGGNDSPVLRLVIGGVSDAPGDTADDSTLPVLYNSAEFGGIYRCDDNQSPKELKVGTAMNSVAFNGTNLVAGAYATNIVYRSADPLVACMLTVCRKGDELVSVHKGGVLPQLWAGRKQRVQSRLYFRSLSGGFFPT